MPRPKGLPKTGGRVKGTPNKIKLEVRLKIADFIIGNFPDFVKEWKALPPGSPVKFNTYVNLMKYVIPPVAAEQAEETKNEIASAISKSINDLKMISNDDNN